MNDYQRRYREESKKAYTALMKFYPLTTDNLPDDLRATIRQEYKPRTTGRSCCALAKKYGVTPQTVWKIVHENNVDI